ncbi:MAG: sigma-70 family RNA polymerase sigma factor [Verrucomicrobiia bacterium]
MNDDMELVRAFVTSGSERAFAALVERHVGLVHSAALRQVRDPHLAEEVSQSVFVLLARKASSLGPTTILSAWLYRTTRHVAADTLKAQRRRQAREQEAYMRSQLEQQAEDAWKQFATVLDEAMESLGETDRAALVLRYFEKRTAREIAGMLSLEAGAAQKRVTRALEKLRTVLMRRGVCLSASAIAGAMAANAVEAAPAGLAAAITSTAAQTGAGSVGLGIGLKALSALAKGWFVAGLALAATVPSLIFAFTIGRMEQKNYRDAGGFRPQLYRRFLWSFLWGFPILLLAVFVAHSYLAGAWGERVHQKLTLLLLVGLTLLSARSLAIARNPFQVSAFFYCVILTVGTAAVFSGWIPGSLGSLPLILATVLFAGAVKHRPARMDYSLFLRAAHGMVAPPANAAGCGPLGSPLDAGSLMQFARFLGSRYLVTNYRWQQGGLLLRLPPVRTQFLSAIASLFGPFVSRRHSRLLLGNDGTVTAHCCPKDAAALAQNRTSQSVGLGDSTSLARELETTVQGAVERAWSAFRDGRPAAAARALGEAPASEIFVVPPSRARSTRGFQVWAGATVLLMTGLMVLQIWAPTWLDGWKEIDATEAEVRAFLNDTTPNPDRTKFSRNSPAMALFSCLLLPSTNLFTPESLIAMRDEVAGSGGFNEWKAQPSRAHHILTTPLPRHALASGWISLQDLDLTPLQAETAIRESFRDGGATADRFLTRCEAWSWLKRERFLALRIKLDGVAQLKVLQAVNCLDLVDREGLIQQIASVQVLSTKQVNQPQLHDWRAVKGLFFTPCYPALEDTYYSLAALQSLAGLDRIDREACIQGILRRHHGTGYFTSPQPGGYNEYHINGGARDTIAAFEALRILGALDRVKDLDRWVFRVKPRRVYQQTPTGDRLLTWEAAEAAVAQQRLDAMIRARKNEPARPFESLAVQQ